MADVKFHIANMTCSGCARAVTGILKTLDTRTVGSAVIASRTIEVPTSSHRAEIEAALAQTNFSAHFIAETNRGARHVRCVDPRLFKLASHPHLGPSLSKRRAQPAWHRRRHPPGAGTGA
ncbi:heavy-metal-associated domain-containing protein [uncultured Limimaricola sp.]|uniref:heavy-metal-associated domain-containing protein n=1 Tax=uncultured Limimaricola sp. TaxID=2211667 RepID=UPI0030F87C3A